MQTSPTPSPLPPPPTVPPSRTTTPIVKIDQNTIDTLINDLLLGHISSTEFESAYALAGGRVRSAWHDEVECGPFVRGDGWFEDFELSAEPVRTQTPTQEAAQVKGQGVEQGQQLEGYGWRVEQRQWYHQRPEPGYAVEHHHADAYGHTHAHVHAHAHAHAQWQWQRQSDERYGQAPASQGRLQGAGRAASGAGDRKQWRTSLKPSTHVHTTRHLARQGGLYGGSPLGRGGRAEVDQVHAAVGGYAHGHSHGHVYGPTYAHPHPRSHDYPTAPTPTPAATRMYTYHPAQAHATSSPPSSTLLTPQTQIYELPFSSSAFTSPMRHLQPWQPPRTKQTTHTTSHAQLMQPATPTHTGRAGS